MKRMRKMRRKRKKDDKNDKQKEKKERKDDKNEKKKEKKEQEKKKSSGKKPAAKKQRTIAEMFNVNTSESDKEEVVEQTKKLLKKSPSSNYLKPKNLSPVLELMES